MLQRPIQDALIGSYVNTSTQKAFIKKGFDKQTLEAKANRLFLSEGSGDAAILYVDIANFSSKVKGLQAGSIREYLDAFYHVAIPIIYFNGGMIDRIMGDGIIAVFSHALQTEFPEGNECLGAIAAAQSIITRTHGGEHASKAALSYGNVRFCVTGLSQVYEDYTIIGNPLTEVHRLEAEASEDTMLVPRNSPLGLRLERARSEARLSLVLDPDKRFDWLLYEAEMDLRGLGTVPVFIARYVPTSR